MSFGFSVSDIIQSAQVARYIVETFFSRHNRADVHYLQFGRDVADFERLLVKFQQAYNEYGGVREVQLGVRHYHAWHSQTVKEKQEQEEQVGGFDETLNQCRTLLEENRKYLTERASVWDNARWHLFSGQERADMLRSRLQFHSTKIGVFMQTMCFSMQASMTDALRDIKIQLERLPLRVMEEILAGISRQPRQRGLRPVTPNLHIQYMAALEVEKPDAFTTIDRFPLKEGLDALVNALDQSTTRFPGTGLGIWRPTVQQLNNLVKARWIFDQMRHSQELRDAGPDSLWRWCLETIEERLKTEYSRFEEEIAKEEANIASLDTDSFRIWMQPQEVHTTSASDPDLSQHEEKLLEISLESTGQTRRELIVFRRPRNELRLVTITSLNPQNNVEGITSAPHEDNKVVNMHQVQVVPRYALQSPRGIPGTRIIELCFPGASSGYTYQFKMDEDLFKFQRALLGYKVVYDYSNCKWTYVQSRGMFAMSDKVKGSGRVQIWQPKELPPAGQMPSQGVGNPRFEHARTESIYSGSTTSTAMRSRPFLPEPSPEGGNVVALRRPAFPLMVIFTEMDKNPAFIVLKLENGIKIHHKSCHCGHPQEMYQQRCVRTVLERNPSKRDKFVLTQLHQDPDAGLSSWNIALFGHPRHPRADTLHVLKNILWISVDTESPDDRHHLQSAIQEVKATCNEEQRVYDAQRVEIQLLAERPKYRRANMAPGSSRRPSISNASSHSGMRAPSLASGSASSHGHRGGSYL